MLLPPPHFGLQVVSIDSLKAALVRMDIKVSVEDIISVIRELEEARCAEMIAQATEHLPPLPECKSPTTTARLLFFNPSNMLVDCRPLEPSRFVRHSPRPEKADPPMPIEHRRRLLELFEQAYPDGVPDPSMHEAWIARRKASSL